MRPRHLGILSIRRTGEGHFRSNRYSPLVRESGEGTRRSRAQRSYASRKPRRGQPSAPLRLSFAHRNHLRADDLAAPTREQMLCLT
jgi:hypothetical protein